MEGRKEGMQAGKKALTYAQHVSEWYGKCRNATEWLATH
jgi:hypothetical protein